MFPGGSAGKESTCSAGDLGTHPLKYFGLENSMDHAVPGVAKSRTRLRLSLHFPSLAGEFFTTEPPGKPISEVQKKKRLFFRDVFFSHFTS